MKDILAKGMQDIFSKEVILFVLKITAISMLTSGVFIWYFWGSMAHFIGVYLSWIPWEWLQTSGANIMTFALSYMLFIISITLFTSLYSEKLLIQLAKKHYPLVEVVGTPRITTSLLLTLKASMIALFLFMFLFVFLFIPIVGQVVLVYLWSILLREPTLYDVGTLFINDKKKKKEKRKKTRLLAMIASLFNAIPVLNLFAPVFAQILFLHHILAKEAH